MASEAMLRCSRSSSSDSDPAKIMPRLRNSVARTSRHALQSPWMAAAPTLAAQLRSACVRLRNCARSASRAASEILATSSDGFGDEALDQLVQETLTAQIDQVLHDVRVEDRPCVHGWLVDTRTLIPA